MISIFNGNKRGPLEGAPKTTFVQFTHDIVPYLKLFGASDWMVFSALSLHMDGNGYCFPSMHLLCEITGLSSATVRRAIDNLCAIAIDDRPILAKRFRYDRNGRQTSNGYVLFPEPGEGLISDRGEGVKNDTGEGIKNDTPITLNKNHKEQEPQGRRVRTRKAPVIPDGTDPGRLIFEAYRSAVFPELDHTQFTLGEWIGARHIVYQMAHKGITPDIVRQATQTLILKWGGKRDIVTINALWKHWSAATTGAVVTDRQGKTTPSMAEVATNAIDVFRRVSGES